MVFRLESEKKYPKATFVHCASHRLNLVVNDLNSVVSVRNACGTIKAIIKCFRDSPKRRKLIPNVPLLSETRWTSKYKSIRIFSEKFPVFFSKLEELETGRDEKPETRQGALHLRHAAGNALFLICLGIISKYSAILEPVTQMLQAVNTDILGVKNHIAKFVKTFKDHRECANEMFTNDVMPWVKSVATELEIDLTMPRQCARQIYRGNVGGTLEEYYCRTVFIPYLDSLIQSLDSRFGEQNSSYFNIFCLHPNEIKQLSRSQFKESVSSINEVYPIDNLVQEALTWYDVQKHTSPSETQGMIDLLEETTVFPAVRKVILVALTLPATSCTVERSFSTLRRVKTWLRSTMGDARLSGLCMLSVHREKVDNNNKFVFMDKVIDKFGRDPRRLQFVFN